MLNPEGVLVERRSDEKTISTKTGEKEAFLFEPLHPGQYELVGGTGRFENYLMPRPFEVDLVERRCSNVLIGLQPRGD